MEDDDTNIEIVEEVDVVAEIEIIKLPQDGRSVSEIIYCVREKVMKWGIAVGIAYNILKAIVIVVGTFIANDDWSFAENMAISGGLIVFDLITTPINYPLVGFITVKIAQKCKTALNKDEED
ncbi:hypothetical protein HN709_04965 [Candidatus Peregrinibacteria bacterium]|jgi:hypothetical protein|nr:hypothetical protein [Candidatus Peregrinibacteria bacterium]MBT7737013.1 hypothetical protein [Candidatus Peregrinibacteria bacterium]